MLPVLVSFLTMLRDSLRSRVALQAETVALRHQLLILQLQEAETAAAIVGRRSSPLGLALPYSAGMESGSAHRKTGDCDGVAPQRL